MSYSTTDAMKRNARRGLDLREKYKRGGLDTRQAGSQGIGSGVARASDIIDGSLSLEYVKRMHAFFSRHEKNYRPSERESDGGPTAGTIAWLLWGGSAGRSWARGILRKEGLLEKSNLEVTSRLVKAADEKRQATFVVLEPQDPDGMTSDLHLDWYDAETVEKACRDFNDNSKRANILHMMFTDGYRFIESYIAPADFEIEGKSIKKGSWIATIEVSSEEKYDWIWQGIKSGAFNGLSVQCMGSVESLE